MRKLLTITIFLIISIPCKPQQVSVSRLDIEWRRLYYNGCQMFGKGNLEEAELLLTKSVKLLMDNDAETSYPYMYSLMKLAETYFGMGKNRELARLDRKICDLRKKIRPESRKYIVYHYYLAIYYSNTAQYAKAIDVLDIALGAKALDTYPEYKQRMISRKAICYYCLGQIEKAVDTQRLSMDGDVDAESTQALAYYLFLDHNYEELDEVLPLCFELSREPVLKKFTFSSADDRAKYWSENGKFFSDYLPLYTGYHPSKVITSVCYNAQLLSKGVLLAASNRTKDVVFASGDKILVGVYLRYLSLKGLCNRTVNEDVEMQSLYDVLIKYQTEHKSEYRKDFRVRWTDIREKMSDDDIAIEFINVNKLNGESDYAALTIKKDYESPHYIRLCDSEQIASVLPRDIYTSSALYNLIWQPLEQELEGVENVFFSPAGILHKLGIEYLPNDDLLNMNNLYKMHRLSSTKEIILSRPDKRINSIVLFGGINYNASPVESDSQIRESNQTVGNIALEPFMSRSGMDYLPGTMSEVMDISNRMKIAGVKTSLFTGDNGSESNFKALADSSYDILHIATHGFYFTADAVNNLKSIDKTFRDANLHFVMDDIILYDEDRMLTNSGLVLAGANNIIRNMASPIEMEDGILYASEIANVNLESIDLAVLSACQSGLGDVNSSEGVFGLQRGFKLAGVHSILMSLWKVDDAVTKVFMSEFYKNVANGEKYSDALIMAQDTLRVIDDGLYDDPVYWAAFVLLDAL